MAHLIPGRRAVVEALRAGRGLHEVLVERGTVLDELEELLAGRSVEVRRVERTVLDELGAGLTHQGVLARAPAFEPVPLADLDSDLLVLLDGVTDPQNLGAVARSAEAAGATGLVLPRRRSAQVTPAAEKAAAGAFSWLPVAVVPNLDRALTELAGRGAWSVGLDGDAPAALWDCALLDGPVALVVGAEGRGLSRLVRERCDALAAIPMAGRLDSLNVSAAAAVALFEARRRRGAPAGGRGHPPGTPGGTIPREP